jgi:exodeoxyribonuclease V alpha subunit
MMSDRNDSGPMFGLERHFAQFVGRFGGTDADAVRLAASLLSRAAGNGDICLDLRSWAGRLLDETWGCPTCPSLARWLAALRASPAVGTPGERRPLVLDERHRLYLYRYWNYENRLATRILQYAGSAVEPIDRSALRVALQRGFLESSGPEPEWQKVAVAVGLLKRLTVITGRPGTGKTTTVKKLLSVYTEMHPGQSARVLLAAPTGKAAARMKESLASTPEPHARLADSVAAVPEVYTLHRLLRPVAGLPIFRHGASQPLAVDLMIVDEVSMVDLALMAKLVDALPETARLVLIGDRDQLASVEAGSILSDICGQARLDGFSPEFGEVIRAVTGQAVRPVAAMAPLQDCTVELQTSHRFGPGSGIAALSRAVNRGDAVETLEILAGRRDDSVAWLEPGSDCAENSELQRQIALGYAACLTDGPADEVLATLGRFKILCAHRAGSAGVNAVNRLTEALLSRQGRISDETPGGGLWYAGRPVLITQNDYGLGLFNGDLGVALKRPGGGSEELEVFFKDGAGDIRCFMPYRLPSLETAWALTVHKSQGSEFDEVLFVLPPTDSPVLSRELIYTALTRARRRITVFGRREVIETAVRRRIERTSGLRDALWGVRAD